MRWPLALIFTRTAVFQGDALFGGGSGAAVFGGMEDNVFRVHHGVTAGQHIDAGGGDSVEQEMISRRRAEVLEVMTGWRNSCESTRDSTEPKGKVANRLPEGAHCLVIAVAVLIHPVDRAGSSWN